MPQTHEDDPRTPPARTHAHDRSDALGRLLDLDAEVNGDLLDEALDAVSRRIGSDAVRRVLDVGAGTGAATFRLSARHPGADIVTLDADPAMTGRIASRATRIGGAHVRTLTRPLLATGLETGSVDLAWASSVFHEFDDPGSAFAVLSELIRPGGILAILEMDAPPRVLPDRLSDLELRLRHVAHADGPRPDWTAQLSAAGFELLETRTLSHDRESAADGAAGAYARAELERLASHAAGLNAREEAALADILAARPGSPLLPDVRIRGSRTLWIARRP